MGSMTSNARRKGSIFAGRQAGREGERGKRKKKREEEERGRKKEKERKKERKKLPLKDSFILSTEK